LNKEHYTHGEDSNRNRPYYALIRAVGCRTNSFFLQFLWGTDWLFGSDEGWQALLE
jgi:hypothetical protein